MSDHRCTAECWAYLIRNGVDENSEQCNPFEAQRAAG